MLRRCFTGLEILGFYKKMEPYTVYGYISGIRPDGRWSFVMYKPYRRNYSNEYVFLKNRKANPACLYH
jgi:hypothetical protein